MGRISCPLNVSLAGQMLKSGFDSRWLTAILNAIPGDTRVISFGKSSQPVVGLAIPYDLELENDMFPDGTTIAVTFVRYGYVHNGGFKDVSTVSGVQIIPPGGTPVGAGPSAPPQSLGGHSHNFPTGAPPAPGGSVVKSTCCCLVPVVKTYNGLRGVYDYCDGCGRRISGGRCAS